MLTVPLIFLGAAFCLVWAYALGRLCVCRLPAPPEVAFAIGAAAESYIVFALLCTGAASTGAFAGIGVVSILLAWRFRGPSLKDLSAEPAPRAMRIAFRCILAIFGLYYFVHAMAPEIQSDAISYHLGLPAEYSRTGAFPDRVAFFEMVPQGMEMLFTVAFGIGQHSAAKLVHFGFLLATPPLLMRIGRRLRLSDSASMAVAGLYFCAPITGVAGTCAYNDAALVYFVLIVFYLLLVWREQEDEHYLLPAAIAAGFCYAIKFTGILILPLTMAAALAASRRLRPVLTLAAGALLIAPWMIRDAVLSGNPVAPLFNRWFPNPHFHVAMEIFLANTLRSYGVPRWRIPWELAVGGNLQGIYGPLFFLLPVGLLALRRREGRWCWLAAGALALPWFWNIGGRFFMPAYVFALLSLMMAVPRAALACLILQAVTCWPHVISLYNDSDIWRLREFPWQAALRRQPPDAYLDDHIDAYRITRLVESMTPPHSRIFTLTQLASAYTERETLDYWHSAESDRMLDWLRRADRNARDPIYDVSASWQSRPLRALRFRLPAAHRDEWCIHEVRLRDGSERVKVKSSWTLSGWPNPVDMPFVLDDNLGSEWRTWEPMRAGMFLEIDFDRAQWLSGATVVSHTAIESAPVEFYGQDAQGAWHSFGGGKSVQRVWEDLRRPATRAIRRQGFTHLVTPPPSDSLGLFSQSFAGHEEEWGLERLAEAHGYILYRIVN